LALIIGCGTAFAAMIIFRKQTTIEPGLVLFGAGARSVLSSLA
jgi:hypothetical protein